MEIEEVQKLRSELEESLQQAHRSRDAGREGRARVQARILAGRVIEAYAHETGGQVRRNAWDWLKWLAAREDLPLEMTRAAQRLTVRVTPDFTLPHPEDPLEDADMIVRTLLIRLS